MKHERLCKILVALGLMFLVCWGFYLTYGYPLRYEQFASPMQDGSITKYFFKNAVSGLVGDGHTSSLCGHNSTRQYCNSSAFRNVLGDAGGCQWNNSTNTCEFIPNNQLNGQSNGLN